MNFIICRSRIELLNVQVIYVLFHKVNVNFLKKIYTQGIFYPFFFNLKKTYTCLSLFFSFFLD